LIVSETLLAEKTDTVYLYNGDRITGEIKRLEYGILFLKTDGLGTLNIEFDRIRTFYSKHQFIIQLENGLRFYGSLDTSNTPGYITLLVNEFRIPEPIEDIVEIYPVKNRFWKRLDGAIDLGYSYSKASTVSQLNFSGHIDYRVQKSFTKISGSSTITDQQDRDRIRNQDYSVSFWRFFKNRWFAGVFSGAQQNTELGTDYRFYGGLGSGRDLVHTNRNVLSGIIGFLVSTEKSQGDSIIQSVEGVMQLNYRLFKFNDPEIDVTSYFNYFPSITSAGRHRLEYQVKARIELFNDFYFGLTYYDNYDSKPLDPTAEKNDWGITTSIGYSW
jgi:hypothetical protein